LLLLLLLLLLSLLFLLLLYIIQTTLKYCTKHYSRNSLVGNAIRLRSGRSEVGIPEEERDFSLLHNG
jgi:hypothetical protein